MKSVDQDHDFRQSVPLSENWEYRGEPAGAWNVVGVLEGTDPSASAIVIGAHHDHLGKVEAEAYYPGADDNASGVAALLSVAESLAEAPKLNRTVVFITFTGEEFFFQGSRHYLDQPLIPLDRTVLMINLDMVGRLRDSRLQVSGLGTMMEDRELVRRHITGSRIPVEILERVHGGSDHRRFADAGIPVLHVTTGNHADNHKQSDTIEKIDVAGVEAVADLVAGLVQELGRGED